MPETKLSNIKTLNIQLINHRYSIYLGGVLSDFDFGAIVPSSQFLIVTHPNLRKMYAEKLQRSISKIKDVEIYWYEIESGEKSKNFDSLNDILTQALELGLRRNCCFVAFGGGVIGDLTGLSASLYQRGAYLIQIPTTVLAQVDASIGGKTAINHELGKNMIGSFYHPNAVVMDLSTLNSLPDREFISGIAEIIKYSLISDKLFFHWLQDNMSKLLNRSEDTLIEAIFRSCEHKRKIIEQDENEKSIRALLNLGHTFAHALESLTGYEYWLHGEAVSMGIVFASRISCALGYLAPKDVEDIAQLLKQAKLPVSINKSSDIESKITPDACLQVMALDKKNVTKNLRMIMMRGIGEAFIIDNIAKDVVYSEISKWMN